MSTFDETAIVDYSYRLSIADQGKQTSVFCFRLQQTNGMFSVCGIPETWRPGHGDMEVETSTWKHGDGDMKMESWRWRHGNMEG